MGDVFGLLVFALLVDFVFNDGDTIIGIINAIRADAKFYMNELVYLVPTSERESEQASRFAGDLASVAYELGERGYRQSFIDLCMSRIETADSKF